MQIRLTERDRAILADVVRFGALTVDQVTRRHFGATAAAYRRLAALADAGYPGARSPGWPPGSASPTSPLGTASLGLDRE